MDNNSKIFCGHYEVTLDKDGTLILPEKYTEILSAESESENGFYFFISDMVLCIYSEKEMNRALEEMKNLSGKYARMAWYMTQHGASIWQPDGKITIPDWFLEKSGLNKQSSVTLLGVKNRIEIWDTNKWETELAVDEETVLSELNKLLDGEMD